MNPLILWLQTSKKYDEVEEKYITNQIIQGQVGLDDWSEFELESRLLNKENLPTWNKDQLVMILGTLINVEKQLRRIPDNAMEFVNLHLEVMKNNQVDEEWFSELVENPGNQSLQQLGLSSIVGALQKSNFWKYYDKAQRKKSNFLFPALMVGIGIFIWSRR